jgi:DNA-binding transcriptional ArsR family regulator
MTNATVASQFTALSDPTRRILLERLAQRSLKAGEAAEGLSITRPAVSQHLMVLLEAELVSVEQRGTSRIYSLNEKGVKNMRAYLDSLWDEALQNFKRAAEKGK